MQKKYLLPPLSGANTVTSENCWEEEETPYDFLLKYMQLYYDPNVSVFEGGSNAIPHAYEQMLIFHKAFFDEYHPEHQRAVLEWRAVLIIMALQKIKNLHLDLVKVDLKEDSKNPFIHAAATLCPEDTPVVYQTTWDFLYVLRLKGTPIAIFSPMTLVCPAKQFFKKIENNINPAWLVLEKVNGKEDLIIKTRKNDNLYANLVDWLKLLNSKVTCYDQEDGECTGKTNKIKYELEEFIKFCYDKGADGKNIDFYIKKDIYPSISNNVRKEYDFLNCCCDFKVKDEKFEFLVERYEEDIFSTRLIVVVYDKRPDAMEQKENIEKLDNLFHDVLEINGDPVVCVKKYGGERVAAYALLPFREQLVKELMEYGISPSEFFEEFSVVYNSTKEQMEVVLQIEGFPYIYEKAYEKNKWQYIYGIDITETYIWPRGQMAVLNWKLYYTYAGNLNPNIEVSVPMEEKKVSYKSPEVAKIKKKFELTRTKEFPAYICYASEGVKGYLPLKTEHLGQNYVGGIMDVFIDIGHSTTSVILIKREKHENGEKVERIPFKISPSVQVTGKADKTDSGNYNFIGTDRTAFEKRYFKNMLHRFDDYESAPASETEMGSMGKGQILYDNCFYGKNIKDTVVSFLNFEYIYMQERDRENVHMYIQQILLNAVCQAAEQQCTYLSVHFLHPYDNDNDSNLGELQQLWKHNVERIKEWTGIYKCYGNAINSLQIYKALAYNTYRLLRNEMIKVQNTIEEGHIYIGMDIGWKDTHLAFLTGMEEKNLQMSKVSYAKLEYAGRDISLMGEDESELRYNFKRYSEMLSILLNGTNVLNKNSKTQEVLTEFSKLYLKDTSDLKNKEYYQGLYDVIAMMIEEENFKVSPDVYNNMVEFRGFIAMMTYNILLLFFEMGVLLGKLNGIKKKVTIYLSGNGAKFIRWISHYKEDFDKDYFEICNENCKKVWLLDLKESVLEIIQDGLAVIDTSTNHRNVEIKIIFQENMKEQLLEGYIYKEIPSVFGEDSVMPTFTYERLDTMLNNENVVGFKNSLEQIYEDVFSKVEANVHKETNVAENGYLEQRNTNMSSGIPQESGETFDNQEPNNRENGNGEQDNQVPNSPANDNGEQNNQAQTNPVNDSDEQNSQVASNLIQDSINILSRARRKACREIIERINNM